jgi:hypothetical protein
LFCNKKFKSLCIVTYHLSSLIQYSTHLLTFLLSLLSAWPTASIFYLAHCISFSQQLLPRLALLRLLSLLMSCCLSKKMYIIVGNVLQFSWLCSGHATRTRVNGLCAQWSLKVILSLCWVYCKLFVKTVISLKPLHIAVTNQGLIVECWLSQYGHTFTHTLVSVVGNANYHASVIPSSLTIWTWGSNSAGNCRMVWCLVLHCFSLWCYLHQYNFLTAIVLWFICLRLYQKVLLVL